MWWKRKQRDFHAEIEAHLNLEAVQLVSEGLTPREAQAAARRAFGNRTSAEERFYESTHWMLFDHLVRDVGSLRAFSPRTPVSRSSRSLV